jgi:hypothetical protein
LDGERNYPKTTKLYCLGLGMSEQEISALLDAEPANRTHDLIRLFDKTPEEEGKRRVLHLLYDIGDEEITENFFADLLHRSELAPALKSWLTTWSRLHRYRKEQRVRAQFHGWTWPREKVRSGKPPNTPKKPAKVLAFLKPTEQ